MKKIMLAILFLWSVTAFAQRGFFLCPEIGIGIANTKAQHPPNTFGFPYGLTWQQPTKNVFTYNPSVLAGYQLEHWRITAGISFLKTGYKEDTTVGGGAGVSAFWFKETQYYYHLMIPIVFAYECHIGDHFSFTPGVGGAFTYNTSSVIRTDMYNLQWGDPYKNFKLTDDLFKSNYNRTGYWGIVQAQFGYKVNGRLNIVAGPEVQYMLTSILKDNSNSQINYAYTFKAGIIWNVKRPAKDTHDVF